MEPGSPSTNASEQPPPRLADIVGTFIALLTLTLPVFVIAYYSSSETQVSQPSTYKMPVSHK